MSTESDPPLVEVEKSNFEAFLEYFYNPAKGEVLGRNALSWGKIGLFYLIYYGCLAGFWAIMAAGFASTLSGVYPSIVNMETPIKGNPGMGYRPRIDVRKTLISFTQSDNRTYLEYLDSIEEYLQEYTDVTGGRNCTDGRPADFDPKKDFCQFKTQQAFSEKCSRRNNYGFADGQPCVILKLNKVYDWEPEPLPTGSEQHPEADGRHVLVTCEGENGADRDNIGKVEFFPPTGFSIDYFPYMNQDGYQSPFVFVRFDSVEFGVLIQVWCKAWDSTMYHHKYDRAASVHFELLVD